MEAHDLVCALEDDEFPVPDQAQVKVLTEAGEVYTIVGTQVEEDGGTIFLLVEVAE